MLAGFVVLTTAGLLTPYGPCPYKPVPNPAPVSASARPAVNPLGVISVTAPPAVIAYKWLFVPIAAHTWLLLSRQDITRLALPLTVVVVLCLQPPIGPNAPNCQRTRLASKLRPLD